MKRKQKESDPFVVKAQCSLFSSDGAPSILIYDDGKHVMHQGYVTPEIAETVGERSFWWATVKNGNIAIQSKNPATEDEFYMYNYEVMNP